MAEGVTRLRGLGATVLGVSDDPTVTADPEGNELCVVSGNDAEAEKAVTARLKRS